MAILATDVQGFAGVGRGRGRFFPGWGRGAVALAPLLLCLAYALVAASVLAGEKRKDAGGREVIPVGVCMSLTGEFAIYGKINLAGMRLFVKDWNAKEADQAGFSLELVERDDAGDAETAVKILDEMADAGIQVIAGPVTSGMMLRMLERAKERRMVLISPGATSPKINAGHIWGFKVLPGDDYQGGALARFFARHMNVEKVASAVNDTYEYGDQIFQAFKREFTSEGGKVIAKVDYSWDIDNVENFDFTETIAGLMARKPDMVLLPGYARECAELIRQSAGKGWSPIFCGGDAWQNHRELTAAGPGLDDSYYIGGSDLTAQTPQAKRFFELMDASTDPDLEIYSVEGFDVMAMIAQVAADGARTADEIREAIYKRRVFHLAGGRMIIDEKIGTGKTLYIYRITQMNGTIMTETVAAVEPD